MVLLGTNQQKILSFPEGKGKNFASDLHLKLIPREEAHLQYLLGTGGSCWEEHSNNLSTLVLSCDKSAEEPHQAGANHSAYLQTVEVGLPRQDQCAGTSRRQAHPLSPRSTASGEPLAAKKILRRCEN